MEPEMWSGPPRSSSTRSSSISVVVCLLTVRQGLTCQKSLGIAFACTRIIVFSITFGAVNLVTSGDVSRELFELSLVVVQGHAVTGSGPRSSRPQGERFEGLIDWAEDIMEVVVSVILASIPW